MPEQNRPFDEVRQILRRMDRSIDEAREKRLSDSEEKPEASESRAEAREPERATPREPEETIGGNEDPRPLGQTAKRAGSSGYGRAKPLRQDENDNAMWRSA